MKPALRDLRLVAVSLAVIVLTWLALGHLLVDRVIAQADGSVFVAPYTQSALAGGFDWTHHLYRFGVLGGSAMHDFGGTLPLVQLCALLGISTTLTVNLVTIAVQLGFAYFGVTLIESLVATWRSGAQLGFVHRTIAIWLCAFAPIIGWRIAWGHDNLLWGCLPFVAAIAGWCAARAGRLSAVTLVMIALATWHGVSTLGAQTLIYSAVFGMPLAAALVWPRRDARRPAATDGAAARDGADASRVRTVGRRAQLLVIAALVAGLLVALPRLVGMLAYATGDDTARSLDAHLTYSFGTAGWRDWLGSIPWTTRGAASLSGDVSLHEHQFPIGPLVLLLLLAWPRTAPKRWLVGLGAGTLLAILFAGDVWPVSNALLAIVKPLGAFRVPARAVMPLFVLVPPLALASIWSRAALIEPTDVASAPASSRTRWLALALGVVAIVLVRDALPWPREILAWLACAVIVIVVRAPAWFASTRLFAHRDLARDLVLVLVAALGVCAFTERFPRGLPNDPIEGRPAQLHDAALAEAPELASPLVRIEILEPDMPYVMSTAFAARLGSLDGDYNPTRRFLDLVSAASGHRLPPTAVVFQLGRDRSFPLLQQLYNVHYILGRVTLEPLPPTPGAAWFPERIATAPDADAVVRALHAEPNLRETLLHTAWLGDSADAARVPATCTGATVRDIAPDALGQSATISVTTRSDCVLVVSTNYVSFLRAHTSEGEPRELTVIPIDIALTGIVVPAGADRVVLEPVATIPLWTRIASIIGVLLLVASIAVAVRRVRP